MARRPLLPLVWRGVTVIGLAALIVFSGESAVSAGWALLSKPGSLGNKVLWAGFALLSACCAAWFARTLLLDALGVRRRKGPYA
jgi:hypothetical protein